MREEVPTPLPIQSDITLIVEADSGTALAASEATQFPEADMTRLRTAFVAGALLTTTLAGQTEYKSWPLSQAPAELRLVISHADLVVVEMQGAVLRELTDSLAHGGPAGPAGLLPPGCNSHHSARGQE